MNAHRARTVVRRRSARLLLPACLLVATSGGCAGARAARDVHSAGTAPLTVVSYNIRHGRGIDDW